MYKALIFDFFDVVHTDPYKAWLKRHDYKREGIFFDVAQRQDRGEIMVDEFLAVLAKQTGQSVDEVAKEMETSAAQVNRELLEFMEDLRARYKIGLLSNAPLGFLRDLLQAHDLEKYFDHITISSEVGFVKPESEIFHHILQQLGVQPAEALFIDDNPHNVDAASALSIKSLVYTTLPRLKTDLHAIGVT